MKKILFVLAIVLLSSCAWEDTIVPITDGYKQKNKADEYYWYYDNILFDNVDSCQVVGVLKNKLSDNITDVIYINYKCPVYNDTIYIIKRGIAGKNNIFEGTFYIRGKDPCITTIELN